MSSSAQTNKTNQPLKKEENKINIKEILLKDSYISVDEAKKSEEYAKKHDAPFEDYLINQGTLSKGIIGQAMAEHYNLEYTDLNSLQPSKEILLKLPREIALNYNLIPVSDDQNHIVLTSSNPEKIYSIKDQIQQMFPGKKITLTYSLLEDIENNFSYYRKPLETRFSEIIQGDKKIAPEIIDEILLDATRLRASDVHFEPQPKDVLIRFRVDGVLQEVGRVSKEVYDSVLNRIKVQAGVRIDIHFAPQDGAIRQKIKDTQVDMRVSVVPTIDGEKIAIRLLAEYVKGFSFNDLGVSQNDQNIIIKNVKKPFGMVLVCGPTGSGKSTSLYAILKIINQPGVNVTTIEDPVEYKIFGTNQIQVNQETKLTFASGLRSIVRQDPDIILVGEIRDLETAEIATNAALTGHLLLSSFHANDASTAIPRLLDMGIEPFLLASTLELIVAQRLVRKICESCRYSQKLSKEELTRSHPTISPYINEKTITVYRGKGCNSCNMSGFKGRTAIFEYIEVTEEIEEMIVSHKTSQQIWNQAKKQGSISLFEDGMDKVKSGITTIDELLRVAIPPGKINGQEK
jgi:type II secretory ATPase GspE/PulE/Tfp pilus assembly ATPase PilB-like protein